MGLALGAALCVFVITNPFAILDNTCESTLRGMTIPLVNKDVGPITNHSCYLENIATQSAMVRGDPAIPFTFQYIGTPPYLYFVDQMARWGLGPALAAVAFGGPLWSLWRIWRQQSLDPAAEAVLLGWVLPFFALTGGFQVKFLRYLLPLTPVLIVMGAGMLIHAARRSNRGVETDVSMSHRAVVLRATVVVLVVVVSGLWSAAFSNLYRVQEHPWIVASQWMRENVAENSVVAIEHWDHALPIALRPDEGGFPPLRLREEVLEWFDVEDRWRSEETRESLSTAADQVASSDFLVLASNRLYGVIPQMIERYPESAAFYRLLFSGELGFELVYWNARYPTLGPVALVDDTFSRPGLPMPAPLASWQPAPVTWVLGPADESFTVYDHPLVLIFENRERLDLAAVEAQILAAARDYQEAMGN
jgi:hypothetical protein